MEGPVKKTTRFVRTFVPISLLMVSLAASQANAATCPGAINLASYGGVYNLSADLVATTTNEVCLTVTGTGVVDLNGFSIYAPDGTGWTGIECSTTGITIRDSRHATTKHKGDIHGSWNEAIKNCGTIDGVRIEHPGGAANDYPSYGVFNDSTHTLLSFKNSIVGYAGRGVHTVWLGSGGIVHNEIVADYAAIESNSGGSGPSPIAENSLYASVYGIFAGGDVEYDIHDNLVTGLDGTSSSAWCIYAYSGSTVGDNWGSCTGANCAGSTVLHPSTAPTGFDRPWGVGADCPGVVSGGTTVALTSDYDLDSTSGTCIQINDAYTTLDLNGHIITNAKVGGTAISCANGSTEIQDSTKDGGIRGTSAGTLGFATGIENCRDLSYVRMQDVTTGVSNSPTYGLHSIDYSMISAEGTAVSSYMDARSAYITNSHFRSAAAGIYISGVASGSGKVNVSNNAIRESPTYAVKTATSNVNVHNNLMYRGAAVSNPPTSTCLDLTAGTTTSHLMCECESENRCEGTDPVIVYPF